MPSALGTVISVRCLPHQPTYNVAHSTCSASRCPRRQACKPQDNLDQRLALKRRQSSVTGPSSLLQIGPSQCLASVLSSRGFRHLCFSLDIEATGSCSSAREPVSASRPLYAGRRLPSHQAPGRLVPKDLDASGFDDGSLDNDASSKGSLSFVSLTLTCSRFPLNFVSNARYRDS